MTEAARHKRRSNTEPAPSTREAILDTAERLFAQYGVEAVSVRRILAEAKVNVALAHYHFGGRRGLIREVIRRRVEPLNEERLRLLIEAEAGAAPREPGLEATLRAFLAPVVRLVEERPDVARLLGQLHVTADADLREYFDTLFAAVLRRLSDMLRPTLPRGISDPQRLARAHFFFGAMAHLLTNHADMERIARGRFPMLRGEALLRELVAFCAAGISASVAAAPEGRTDS